MKFRYIDRLEYTSDDDRLNLSSASVLQVTLAREIVRSIQAQYIKPINLEFLTSLQRPLTRALYRLLDAQRFDPAGPPRAQISVNIGDWGEACKIVDRKPAKVRRTLDGAHEELIERGYLQTVEYEGRGAKQVIVYHFVQDLHEPEVDPAVVAQVTRYGVAASVARALVRRYGAQRLSDRVSRFEAILAGGYAARNRAALLVDVIRDEEDKYGDPEGFVGRAQRQAVEAQRRQRDVALQRQLNDQDARRDAEWSQLSLEQQAERALRTIMPLFGKRLSPTVLSVLAARIRVGELQASELATRATRAAMELRLQDLADELTILARS